MIFVLVWIVSLATLTSCMTASPAPEEPNFTVFGAEPLSYSNSFESTLHTSLQNPDCWDGSYDTAWTGGNIASAAQLAQFLTLVNNGTDFAGETVTLSVDIDCGDEELPLGTKPFAGTFNGQGHAIGNYTMTATEGAVGIGFFGTLSGNATVENLALLSGTLENRNTTKSAARVGMLAGCVEPGAGKTVTLNHLYCQVSLVTPDLESIIIPLTDTGVGGLIGATTAGGSIAISNCVYQGTVDVSNNGTDSSTTAVGGLIGRINVTLDELAISNCRVTFQSVNGGNSGGLIGKVGVKVTTLTVTDCIVDGTHTCPNWGGGLIGPVNGAVTNFTMSGCVFNGTLSSGRESGGLIGRLIVKGTDSAITNCSIGADAILNLSLKDSKNASECGAIVGRFQGDGATSESHVKLSITNANVLGTVNFISEGTSQNNAGVLVGSINSTNTDIDFDSPSITGIINLQGTNSAKIKFAVLLASRQADSCSVSTSGAFVFEPESISKDDAFLAIPLTMRGWDAAPVNRAVGYQTRDNGDGTYDIRFVFALKMDDCFYDGLGVVLHAQAGGNTADAEKAVNRIYTSIIGGGNTYTAEELGGTYLYTVTIENVPNAYQFADSSLAVTLSPYSKLQDCKTAGTPITNSGEFAQ